MYLANSKATPLLLEELKRDVPTWPTVYHAIDVIANWITPRHYDKGAAISFYNHLISLGQDYDAHLMLDDLYGKFTYQSGISVLFSGKVLAHSVPKWSGGERIMIAYYAKNDV